MNLMLTLMVFWIGLGLLTPRLANRQRLVVGMTAAVATALYYLLPFRFI
jgi:hypothetical protein